jgi:hypothetical protein
MNGSKYLEELLADLEDPAEWKLWIDKILEVLQRKELESSIIDKGVLEGVVQVIVTSPCLKNLTLSSGYFLCRTAVLRRLVMTPERSSM